MSCRQAFAAPIPAADAAVTEKVCPMQPVTPAAAQQQLRTAQHRAADGTAWHGP
jgi:hypothetical protein